MRHTPAMPETVPVREFRTHLASLLDEVADRREHVTVTRRGRPAAVLVPVNEYKALGETVEILSDKDTLAAIRRGLDDVVAGEVTALDDVRAEHAAPLARSGTHLSHPHGPRALGALDLLLPDAALNTLGELELELERNPHLGHQLRGRLTGLRSYRRDLPQHLRTPRRQDRARDRHPAPRQRLRHRSPLTPTTRDMERRRCQCFRGSADNACVAPDNGLVRLLRQSMLPRSTTHSVG